MTHTLLNEKVVSLYITFATLSFHRVSICTFGHVGIRGEAGDLLNEKKLSFWQSLLRENHSWIELLLRKDKIKNILTQLNSNCKINIPTSPSYRGYLIRTVTFSWPLDIYRHIIDIYRHIIDIYRLSSNWKIPTMPA